MNQVTAINRPRAGRPTREQAEARHEELLDRALDHFLDKGYEQATIEAIASDVGMTKRTVYARYADKASLFLATVHRAIERFQIPEERIRATEAEDIETTLRNIAMLRIDIVASPAGMKLQRIIHIESYRFPEIFTESYELGTLPTIRFLAEVFERETRAGRLAIHEPLDAALAFTSMVVTGPVRFILAGTPLSPGEVDRRVAFGVKLFLDGARPR